MSQTPPIYSFDYGHFRCTVIADGSLQVPASFLFANAPRDEVAPLLAAYTSDPDAIPVALSCLLIEVDGQRVLWDTGTGGRWRPGLGQLGAGLASLDVEPESIDMVVISHGHPDHIGGLIDAGGALRYTRAVHVLSRTEWDHWTDESALGAMPADWAEVARAALPAIAASLRTVEGEQEIFPGIRIVPSPGHTPGHIALELRSEASSLLCVGDAMDHPLSVEHPDWLVATDGNPDLTPRTRRDLLRRAAAAESLVFANHFLFPALGRIEPRGEDFVWRHAP